MKPFNLEEAKAGKPVQTRDGRDVRILAFDRKGNMPIIGLVPNKEVEISHYFSTDGKASNSFEESGLELFMKVEKKEMNDQELLQLAAKVAGERIYFDVDGDCYRIQTTPVLEQWNPLEYDCDAFRLAVKLNMGISIPIHQTNCVDVICFKNSAINAREEGDDPYTAARRAIVRVAAEIGKAMEEK